MRIVDAHLHLWDRSMLDYAWLDDEPELPARFLPEDLAAAGGGPDAAVFVQAGCADDQGLDEARWVSSVADGWAALRAIVAFAPLERGAALEEHLDALRDLPLVTGVRRLLQDEPVEWLGRPEVAEGLRRVARAGLVFDACIRHHQLPALVALRRLAPEPVVVLDHLGKPPLDAGWAGAEARAWAAALRDLAAEPGTFVKLSGLAPELAAGALADAARPFVAHALDCFTPERSIAGSDWPVSQVPATAMPYGGWFEHLASGYGLSPVEQAAVLGGTASAVYLRGAAD